MEEQLIEFVRENSFIYDKKHSLYRNQILKNKKWMELSKDVNVPVDMLKKRWKCMRDRFYRVRKNAASVTPDGKSYKYAESLQFLCDEESKNKRITWENEDEGSFDNEETYIVNEASCSADSISETVSSTPVTVSSTPVTVTVPRKRKKTDTVDSEMLDVFKTMKSFADQNVTSFSTFLESIALTVESADCSLLQQTRLQMKILEVVQEEIFQNSN